MEASMPSGWYWVRFSKKHPKERQRLDAAGEFLRQSPDEFVGVGNDARSRLEEHPTFLKLGSILVDKGAIRALSWASRGES
jgi:hypothetical protein